MIRPPAAWFAKARTATNRALKEGANHRFDQGIIGDPLLRAAIEELFYRKCAYCESCLEEVGWDVEHFRPKGRVAEARPPMGYYWLAYKWRNLYASCKVCNQRRRDPPIWGDPRFKPAGGKLDKFPLSDERNRVRTPLGSLSREKALLLDPCVDNPEGHFKYDPTGRIFPRRQGDQRAEKTIEIFRLRDRRRLVRNRKRMIAAAMRWMAVVADLLAKGQKKLARRMRKCVWENLCIPDNPHAGAARAVWKEPKRFGIDLPSRR